MTLNTIPVTVKNRRYPLRSFSYTVLARNILHKTVKSAKRADLIASGVLKPASI
jgi:hypothetical protein